MSVIGLVFTLLAIAASVAIIWFWIDRRLRGSVVDVPLREFHCFLERLAVNTNEYRFYTTGNIVWSETSISEIEKTIRASTVIPAFGVGVGFNPRCFLYHVDEKSRKVYFVSSTEQTFDWASVTHYEDYVGAE